MPTTFACCGGYRRAGSSSCSRCMFTLWPYKWTLLLLVMFLVNKVTAKLPPDPQSPRYLHHWPYRYVDEFAIDSRDFGNDKYIDGNGNTLFGKEIADEMVLRDLVKSNIDVATVPAEERRQRQLQWLDNWLFGQRQQQQQQQHPQTTMRMKQPQWQQRFLRMLLLQPAYLQEQQKLAHLNDIHTTNDAGIVVYKKAPEILLGGEEKLSLETDESENDVADTNSGEEVAERSFAPMNSIGSEYDYDKSDMNSATERFNTEQPPSSKRIFYPNRNRRLDYPYIPYTAYQHDRERELAEAKKLAFKRNKTGNGDQRNFLPSISAGAMTHLGNFFTDLSKNVRYNEKSKPLGHDEAKLLEGQHPLRKLHEKFPGEHEANAVTAKLPPDPQSPRYLHHWPYRYVDEFAIDSRDFGNDKYIDGNGNTLFGKEIADEMVLRDLVKSNIDVATVPAEERRQRQLQWLDNWLFGQRQQQQQQQHPQTTMRMKQPQWQQRFLRMLLLQPAYLQEQQKLAHLNDIHTTNDAGIVVYKKAPEILLGGEEKLSLETDESENDVADTNSGEEVAERSFAPMNSIGSEYDYDKSDMNSATERFNTEQPPSSKRIFYPNRNRRLDYPYIPYTAYQHDRERELAEAKKLAFKRNKTGNGDQRNFLPSISAGAMTHLGNFFTDLSKNVRYNEKSKPLGHDEAKLLEGQHPLRKLHEKFPGEHEANAEILHAIRTYRPSQKIRSLVAMNPRGYHGAQFIDPNYMWVGLGK